MGFSFKRGAIIFLNDIKEKTQKEEKKKEEGEEEKIKLKKILKSIVTVGKSIY